MINKSNNIQMIGQAMGYNHYAVYWQVEIVVIYWSWLLFFFSISVVVVISAVTVAVLICA